VAKSKSSLDYEILGFFAGKLTADTIGFTGIKGDRTQLKALAAAVGTSGASAMFVHLSRSVFSEALRKGLMKKSEDSGGEVMKDICPSLTPTPKWKDFTRVATESAKGSYYIKSALKLGVNLLSAEELVRNYT
jgi:predicted aconitase